MLSIMYSYPSMLEDIILHADCLKRGSLRNSGKPENFYLEQFFSILFFSLDISQCTNLISVNNELSLFLVKGDS